MSDANEKHQLQGESVMVGRDRTCAIVLTHPAVSRRHAKITLGGSQPVLEDLKSANGTYVNNTRVERAKLKPGDSVIIARKSALATSAKRDRSRGARRSPTRPARAGSMRCQRAVSGKVRRAYAISRRGSAPIR